MSKIGQIGKQDVISDEVDIALKELQQTLDKSTETTEKLKKATISLNNKRIAGSEDTIRAERKVNKLTEESVALDKQAGNQKGILAAKQKELAIAKRKTNEETKKQISLSKQLRGVVTKLVASYYTLLGVLRGIGKIKDTLVTLDAFNFAMTKITGSAEEAADAFKFVTVMSEKWGVSLGKTADRYVKFSTAAKQAGLTLADTQGIYNSMSKASGVLGLKTHEVEGVFLALEQMLSKGKITTEELRRQLGERLPGAMGMMVHAYNNLNPKAEVSLAQFDKLLKTGKVLSHEILPEFARVVEQDLGITGVESIDTLQASITRADNAFVIMVEDMEKGTGKMASVFQAFYDTLAGIWQDIGELFLTDAQLNEKYYAQGFSQGQLYLQGIKQSFGSAFEGKDDLLFTETRDILLQQMQREAKILRSVGQYTEKQLLEHQREYGKIVSAYMALLRGEGIDGGTPGGAITPVKKVFIPFADPESIKGLENAIKYTKEIRDLETDPALRNTLTNQLAFYEIEKKYLTGKIDYLEYITQLSKEEAKQRERIDETNDIDFDTFSPAFTAETKRLFQEAGLGVSDEEIDEFLENYESLYDRDFINFTKYIAQKIKEHKKKNKEELKAEDEKNKMILELSIQLGNELFNLGDALLSRQLENIEAEIDATEKKYDRLYDLYDGDRERQKEVMEAKRLEIEKLEAEELKIRQRQAKFKKAQDIANAITNTAVAITEVLPNPFLVALVAALGAAQLATIVAQPIPKYAKGREGGDAEYAIVGDGGRSEIVAGKDGVYRTPSKSTLTYLDKGDSVYPSEEAYKKHLISSIVPNLNNNLELLDIEDAIENGFKKAKVNNYLKMPKIDIKLDHILWLDKNSQF